MSFNLATMLRESASAYPDKAVLLFAGSSLTYAQLDAESGRCAEGLLASGLERGDVVAVQLPNLPEFLVAYFGILKAGMTMLPLNPLLRAPEIAYHLSDASARLLITFPMFLEEAVKAAGEVPLVVVPVPGGQAPDGFRPFADLLADLPADGRAGDITPTNADDTAVLIYTSGTTGKPKGAELTHFQLYMNCTVAGNLFGARLDDVVLAVLPFFHVFGLSSVLNLTVRFGATLSVLARFEAKPVMDAIEADGITVVLGVPTMLQALMAEDTGGRDLSRCGSGSPAERRCPATCCGPSRRSSASSCWRATACPRRRARRRSTAAPRRARCSRSASPSGASRCASSMIRTAGCRAAPRTSARSSSAATT